MTWLSEFEPSVSLLTELHTKPGEVSHTMDVWLPELPAETRKMLQPWVRIRTNRTTGQITIAAAGRLLEHEDDGA